MAGVSLNVKCECGSEFTFTPPKEIQELKEELRYFELHCPYCCVKIGDFHIVLHHSINA